MLLALTFPPRSSGGLMSSTLRWEEASEHPQKSGWEPERKRVDWLVRLGYSRHIGNAEKETLLVKDQVLWCTIFKVIRYVDAVVYLGNPVEEVFPL